MSLKRTVGSGSLASRVAQQIVEYVVETGIVPFPVEGHGVISVAHQDITGAVLAGDGDRAYELMYRHNAEMPAFVDAQYPGLLDAVIPFAL